VSKSEFADWKRHPVTQQVFSQLAARVDQLKDEIVGYAVEGDTTALANKAGAVLAYSDVLNIEYEESHGN
jgi:hypothetical protein